MTRQKIETIISRFHILTEMPALLPSESLLVNSSCAHWETGKFGQWPRLLSHPKDLMHMIRYLSELSPHFETNYALQHPQHPTLSMTIRQDAYTPSTRRPLRGFGSHHSKENVFRQTESYDTSAIVRPIPDLRSSSTASSRLPPF